MDKRVVIAAVEVIASNADILCEILVRLPATSLIRFSVVCKLWYSIITSMHFRLRHSRCLAFPNALPPSGIYFYNYLTNPQEIESLSLTDNVVSLAPLQQLHDKFKDVEFKVTQSCNGLLMFIIPSRKLCLVYNPVNKFCHVLPMYKENNNGFVYYNMIPDPSGPPYYKALCIARPSSWNFDMNMGSLGLYMLESDDSWRYCCPISATGMELDSGVFWNGAMHWIGEYYSVYFDVNSEKAGRINMPRGPQGQCNQKIRYFGEWGGHLHLIRVQSLYAKKFNVLELDKHTLEWFVKYRVHLARLVSAFPEMVQQTSSGTKYAFSILSVMRGEMEEDSVLLLTIPGKVVAYNLVLKTAKVIRDLPGDVGDALRFNHVSAFPYTESLFVSIS